MTLEIIRSETMNKIIWLTGESESGKTTMAIELQKEYECIILDGDEMRDSISLGIGFSREDRLKHNLKIARLAKVLSKQKNIVVAVIAPTKTIRDEINKICSPVWIYIKKDIEERAGHFYEEPTDYFTLNHNELSIEESLDKLKELCYDIEKQEIVKDLDDKNYKQEPTPNTASQQPNNTSYFFYKSP